MQKYRPFSVRQGLLGTSVLQVVDLSPRLRNRLYSVLMQNGFEMSSMFGGSGGGLSENAMMLVDGFFGERVEAFEPLAHQRIRSLVVGLFQKGVWHLIYDFIEFTVANGMVDANATSSYNLVLQEESSGYRFVGTRIVPVTDGTEIGAIEQALGHPITAARDHVARSLAQLAVRPNPNYAKVTAEAIQAVEAAAQYLVRDNAATLGEALKVLKRRGTHHPALLDVFSRLHGWASDEGGVRHAFKGEPVDEDLARYVLVSCAAFIGYLTGVKSKAQPRESDPSAS